MKMKPLIMTALAGVLFSSQAFAVCVKPTNPEIPSGDAASGADMLKAKKAVETFGSRVDRLLNRIRRDRHRLIGIAPGEDRITLETHSGEPKLMLPFTRGGLPLQGE